MQQPVGSQGHMHKHAEQQDPDYWRILPRWGGAWFFVHLARAYHNTGETTRSPLTLQ